MPRIRLDHCLVSRGLAPTRTRAQSIILSGAVFVKGTRLDQVGAQVEHDAEIQVRGTDHPYVSRGGVKLAGALDAFALKVQGLRCLDLGASTGGFTDCLLQRTAASVVAVDVGYGQLAYALRIDPRVRVLERTNARTLQPEQIGGRVDLTVVDVSFIGLRKLMTSISLCTRPSGKLVALIKPQFEAGREEVQLGRGVIRDPKVRAHTIEGVLEAIGTRGFTVLNTCDSVLSGPKGNLESFVLAQRTLDST